MMMNCSKKDPKIRCNGEIKSLGTGADVTSSMQGNFFSLSSLEGRGTSRPQRGSKDSASRNRFSVGPFSLITAPCSSSMASESEWERVEDPGIGVDVQGRGDLGVTS